MKNGILATGIDDIPNSYIPTTTPSPEEAAVVKLILLQLFDKYIHMSEHT